MKRRKIGRKTAKVRKAARRNAPKAAYRRTVAAKDTTVAQLARERDEALHQQAATAEILKLISSSPADTQPVFDAIVRSGLKLFPGAAMFIALPDGDKLRAAAFAATDAVRAKMWRTRWPVPLTRAYMHSAAFLDRKTVDIPDARKPPPELAAGAKNFLLTGYRAVTIVPLMRGRTAIGTLSVVRLAPGKLSDRQNAALKTYAAQAVVAIENTRLLSELRESLEQQTATSEVLKVISSSPGDLEPVFQAMLENAVRICDASFGMLFRNDGGLMNAEAMVGVPPQFAEFWRRGPQRPGPRSAFARTIEKRQIVHIADVKTEPAYVEGEPVFVAAVNLGGFRTLLNVPMLKENEVIGVIAIYRQEVRPFSDKEVELLSNFAAQAVIAIENTRLLNELRQRTDDLSESLEQQTATSAVLKVISSTPGELQPVFDAILKNATRICGAKIGILFRYEGGAYSALAMLGVTPAYAEYLNSGPVRPGPATGLGRVADTKQTIQIVDTQAEHVYAEREPLRVATAELGGARSLLNVPMLKDGILVGAIGIYRQEVRPFTDKQVELVTNFAAQAVIAIENTRLLSELRESLQQQTATSDVLKVISRSTFDLQTVLNTLVESAARLCGAEMANIWRPKDGAYRLTASYGIAARYKEYLENKEFLNTIAIEPGRGTMVGRVLLEKKTVHMHDIQADPDFKLSGLVALGGYRTMLGVPILREGEPIGVFVMVQSEVRPFTD
ncbi:MAG TPA: GAF domain-containing protein, partial [Pseudolabrys sp.]|nr:GAF domain-containing protein [Pseudolabrys sp.]